MVRLAISVEGLTEERFIKMVMVPYLQKRDIYAFPLKLGRIGGNVSLPRIKKGIKQPGRKL